MSKTMKYSEATSNETSALREMQSNNAFGAVEFCTPIFKQQNDKC